MPPLAPLLPNRPTTITALDQPHTLLQFHVFTILQIHRKQANCRSTAPLKPITNLSPAYSLPTAFFPQRPPLPQSPIPILTHFTIQPLRLHWHLFSPTAPQPSQPLTNHTHPITVSRFYDFANSQKTSTLPINRPIKAYYKPITSLFIANSLFPPTPSITPIPHSNFDAFHNPTFTPPLAPLLPNRPTTITALDQPHTPYYSFTFLRFCKFTENKHTADQPPH